MWGRDSAGVNEAMPSPKPGVVEAQLLWSRRSGSGRRRRRRHHRFHTPHSAMVRTGGGLGVRTRRGIPGFELVPPTRSIAPVRPPSPALFSLSRRYVTNGSSSPLFSDPSSSFSLLVPSTSHWVAFSDSLRRPGCMRNAPCIFVKTRGWDLSRSFRDTDILLCDVS